MNPKIIVGLLIVVVSLSAVNVVLLFRLYNAVGGSSVSETSHTTSRTRCPVQNVTVSGSIRYGRYTNVINETYSIVYQKIHLDFALYNGGEEELTIKRIIVDNKYEPRDFKPVTVEPGKNFKNRYLLIETQAYDEGLDFIFYRGSTHNLNVVINVCGEEHTIQTTITSI
ncbi:MAG: hypothetical protein ABIK73_07870 [candidate division WOR-3 bacterium]